MPNSPPPSPDPESKIHRRVDEVPPLYRAGFLRAVAGKASPRGAIKAFCLECVGWSRADVRACTAPACPLYPYRPFQGDGPSEGSATDDGGGE